MDRNFENGRSRALTQLGIATRVNFIQLADRAGITTDDGLLFNGKAASDYVGVNGEIDLEIVATELGPDMAQRIENWYLSSQNRGGEPWSRQQEQAQNKGPSGEFSPKTNSPSARTRGPGRYSNR